MIEAYIKKLDDFETYKDAAEGNFFGRAVQADLDRLAIDAPHILRILHAFEVIIKEQREEIIDLKGRQTNES